MAAGLSPLGSIACREEIWAIVFDPITLPNTGAVIDITTRVVFADAPFGTLPVYEHTPPQPYCILDEEATRLPFSMVTTGGFALPFFVKSMGPYISPPAPTTRTL